MTEYANKLLEGIAEFIGKIRNEKLGLETQLAKARAEIEGLKRENIELLVKYDEKFDVIDRKDKLIEQMRDALRKATNFVGLARARDELSSSHWVYDECIAALSAAERGE